MTDLFAQEGISFESSSLASTHPSTTPDPIPAPKVSQPAEPDAMAAQGSPAPTAPTSNLSGHMTDEQRAKAVLDVFEADADQGTPEAQPSTATPAAPRDLFEQEGINVPTISEVNQNALSAGAPIKQEVAPQGEQPSQVFKPSTTVSARFAKPGQTIDLPQQYQAHEDATMDQIIKTRLTPQEVKALQDKGPIGFWEAFQRLQPNQYLPGGGISQFSQAINLVHIASKIQAGEALTPEDHKTMNDFLQNAMEEKIRGYSRGGAIATGVSQLPAFMIEFALSDGVGKMAQTAAREAAQQVAERTALSAATGVASRVATTSSLMAPHYLAGYGQRRLNDVSAVTDKGQVIFQDAQESPAKSALMAFAHTSADVAAQMAAPVVGKYVVNPATKAVSTPLISAANQLPAVVKDAIYQAYKVIEQNATVSKAFTSAGWAGMIEQLGVNRISQILNATVDLGGDKNMDFDKYLKALTPNADQLLVEGGIVAIAGGVHTASNIAFNLMRTKGMTDAQANETVNNMSALEKENYVNDNIPTPKSEYPVVPEDLQKSAGVHYDISPDSPEQEMMKGQSTAAQEMDPPPIDEKQSNFQQNWKDFIKPYAKETYAALFNDLQPIEDLSRIAQEKGAVIPPGEQTRLLASITKMTPEWIKDNIARQTTTWDSEGNLVATGKGMKQTMDDFDNMFLTTEPDRATRQADFDRFLVAERFLEEAENAQRTGAKVTDEQVQKSISDLKALADKYGDNFRFFGTFADELRDWDKRILQNLVTSGLKTQDWYDEVTTARKKYSPLQRVVEQEHPESVTARNALGKNVTPSRIGSLKQFKGSEKPVKNTFEARMKNAALILQSAMVNRLRVNMAKYAEYYPEDVKIQNPAIIQEAVTRGYDPKLRQRLEAVIEHFGGNVEISKELRRQELASYSEMENLIRMRLGTSEGTLTHEVGHLLDKHLGLGEKLLSDAKIKAELQKLAEDRLGTTISLDMGENGPEFRELMGEYSKKYKEYIKNDHEVIANMFDAYVNAPEQFREVAPRAAAAFEKIIDKEGVQFLREVKPSTARATETLQQVKRDMIGPKNSVELYIDGKRKYMVMSKSLARAMNNMRPIEHSFVENVFFGAFRKSTELLRFGATHYPAFALRHMIRAAYTSFLNIKGSPSPANIAKHFAVEMPKAIFQVLGKGEAYRDWKVNSGGFNTFMDLSDEGLHKTFNEIFNNEKHPENFFNPLKWMDAIKNVSDQSARVVAFKAAKAQGKSDLEAGILSLEATGNYGRHGFAGKRINQYMPFFNDAMQSGDRLVRSMMRDPAGYTIRALAAVTMPQLLISGYYLFAADEKTRDEYVNFPEWSKGVFMHIKIGDTWIPIPRPFATGFIFGAIPEKIMIHMSDKYHPETKNFWFKMVTELGSSMSPVFDWTRSLTPLFKTAIENTTNYSLFRDRPLFNKDLEKTLPQDQYNQFTSETAKMLGKMFDYSPAKIDNTVQDMAGQIGKYTMQLSDAAIRAGRRAEGVPVSEPVQRQSDNPLYGKFVAETPSGTQTESFTEFREHLSDAEQAHNHEKLVAGTKEGADYLKDNRRMISAYPAVEAANKQISQILKRERIVAASTTMSQEAKKQIEQQSDAMINRIVERANMSFRKATGQQ